MAVAGVLGPLGAVALGTLLLALLLRWLWDVAVTTRATCHQLARFPRPRWRNWLLGHTGLVRGQRGHGGGRSRVGGRDRGGHLDGDGEDRVVAPGVGRDRVVAPKMGDSRDGLVAPGWGW